MREEGEGEEREKKRGAFSRNGFLMIDKDN